MNYREMEVAEKVFIYRKMVICNDDTKLKSNILLFVLLKAQDPGMHLFMFVDTVH